MPDTPPRPARTSNYLEPAELAALVRAHRRKRGRGRVSEELGAALLKIAGGVWDRYHFTADRDDFVQEVSLHLLGSPLAKADVKRHLFNYFTTCAIRFGLKLRDKANGDRRRFETYAQECLEAGRELPTSIDFGAPEEIEEGRFSRAVYERHLRRVRRGGR